MNEDLRVLFRELADLSPSQREDYYAQRQVPEAVRAELESLLSFDATSSESLDGLVCCAAEQFLRSGTPVPKTAAQTRGGQMK